MRVFYVALMVISVALQTQQKAQPVGIEMRNVHLHVSDDAALDIAWMSGHLNATGEKSPVFDDPSSFAMEIQDAEIAIDAASLTALVNHAFDFKGSNLSDLTVSFSGSDLVQKGKLSKGVKLPFTVTASVAATPDGMMRVHPEKVKAAGVPTTKIMDFFGIDLQNLIKGNTGKGITIKDNDLILDPSKMLPPPKTQGKLVKVFVRGDRLVQVFGTGATARPAGGGNYIWFRGGTITFGKLTMTDADLKLIDMAPQNPFDFFSAKYNAQLVAGYSKNTPAKGLRTYMPDYAKVAGRR
jgi:hypothetical protein